MSQLYQAELLALPRGERIVPGEMYASMGNYIHRADARHALRQRLTRLALRGQFRMTGEDTWIRT